MTTPLRCDAALLTAAGRGAVAVVRLRGDDVLTVADAVFRPARGGPLKGTPMGRPRLGRVGAGTGDEVVAIIVATDPPEIEFQGHAGPAATSLVLDALRQHGARIVSPEEWVRSTSPSPLIAAARFDLARAPTLRAAEILLDQVEGALDRELIAIRDALPGSIEEARARLDGLCRRAEVGVRLISGWRVVLAGRPNVGKSRLLNALAGYERAIVHSTPGTTRDIVTVATAIDGWPVEVADTAGLRATDDPIEAQGLELARNQIERADLVLLLLDRSEPLQPDDQADLTALPTALRVASKADLPARWNAEALGALAVSAATTTGLEELIREIGQGLVPNPPKAEEGVPCRHEQLEAIIKIREYVNTGRVTEAQACIDGLLGRPTRPPPY